MLMSIYRVFILALVIESSSSKDSTSVPETSGKSLELNIKDDGLVELHAGDLALIFYMTATNTGHDSYHLSVKSEKCCQTIGKDDEDCESMILLGGDMGELFPQDIRNLTLIFPNLYLHDRVGECDMEISSKSGGKMTHKVKFNTTVSRSSDVRPPRLLEQYYDPEDVQNCDSIDKDPLNGCKPVTCYIKYNGFRNFFNHSTERCETLTPCKSESNEELPDTAYVSVSNQCRKIGEKTLSEEDEAAFKHGILGPSLHYMHSYPMNVHCYKGVKDEATGWCICNHGWKSAPFDHATFNPDVQVYHMCTIWTGELTAAEAANITYYAKDNNITNYVIFSTLLTIFVLLFVVIGVCLYRQKIKKGEEGSPYQPLPTDEAASVVEEMKDEEDGVQVESE